MYESIAFLFVDNTLKWDGIKTINTKELFRELKASVAWYIEFWEHYSKIPKDNI